MSTKLEASNETVVSYLTKLWSTELKPKESLIQNLINNNVIDTPLVKITIVPSDNAEEPINLSIDVNISEKDKFTKGIKDNLKALRDVGFRVYHNITLEKEVNLNTKTVTNDEIAKVYDFKYKDTLTRNGIMKDISRCTIFPKYKSGLNSDPSNFRYLVNHHNTVKILDRLWCIDVMEKCGNNLPNQDIYKASLVARFSGEIITTAIENTFSLDNVVMLDIRRAFDSLEWDILEELLLANLTRKINKIVAIELVSHYILILKNRKLYYNNIIVETSKGIPTGLPSSNMVFTLALEEIIYRWMQKNNYTNMKEFKLTVYVDDIYLKILITEKTHEIVSTLITILAEYKLFVNMDKSKADIKLKLENMSIIKNTDYYLGIPFTRDIKLYGNIILKEFQNKHMNFTWNQIYDMLNDTDSHYRSIIIGFMNYKLRPFLQKSDVDIISDFIKKNYVIKSFTTKIVERISSFLSSISNMFLIYK